ncbi:hypothetical protein LMG27952_02628 [Paraburkholderia hiiakae]|uniref:MFS transporter n=1 Tax=Paraburkholderia hiiakae TaxID=1081782 RepID=A0ABM8NLM8_9BURK|nr:hypothetical protein [Paraburkholderia hiiakae]CAD6531847.1 hypothetical protein LMG27952_02628 [Paraburkholderia hiiakae]
MKVVLIPLFGLVTGTTTVICTGQVYSFFFLSHTPRVGAGLAGIYVAIAPSLSIPFFWLFGRLSDRFGRRSVMLSGYLLGALTYFVVFHGLTHCAGPALETAIERAPVTATLAPVRSSSTSSGADDFLAIAMSPRLCSCSAACPFVR